MSTLHNFVRGCTRAAVALAMVTAITAAAPKGSETATELASAPDAPAVSSFSGYMVAVG